MRTREEQIEELVDALKKSVCRPDYSVDILRLWLEKHILEAERRAEQRVREEIGRALESALYTATRNTFARSIGPRTLEIFDQEYKSAIDAAREVKE